MFIAEYCSFLAQSFTVLPQSFGFTCGVYTHTQTGVHGVCQLELTIWELSRSRVTNEETKGDVEETWQGLFLGSLLY